MLIFNKFHVVKSKSGLNIKKSHVHTSGLHRMSPSVNKIFLGPALTAPEALFSAFARSWTGPHLGHAVMCWPRSATQISVLQVQFPELPKIRSPSWIDLENPDYYPGRNARDMWAEVALHASAECFVPARELVHLIERNMRL